MRTLNKEQLGIIVQGATLLASGGGGARSAGQSLVDNFPDDATVQVASVEQAAGLGGRAAVVAYIGAPDAMQTVRKPALAVRALKQLEAEIGEPITSIVPVEIGALSTMVAATTAQLLGVPVVDGDGAGRAVPSLTMLTFNGVGLSADPTVLSNVDRSGGKKSPINVVLRVQTAAQAEALARPIISVDGFNQHAGLALWAMTPDELRRAVTIRGTLQLAEDVGRTLQSAEDPVRAVIDLLEDNGRKAYVLFRGQLGTPTSTTSGGFDSGQVPIHEGDDGPTARTYNLNENLIAFSTAEDLPLAIGPDSICYMTSDGYSFSNADLDEAAVKKRLKDAEIVLLGIRACEELRTQAPIVEAFTEQLTAMGYAGKYVPIETLRA
ncbi:MAG: DUF917 family protein [Alphaproteobacteria bacterium]|nr:DUF917 family protein [Alphaproteobacteria bacterium]